MQFANNFHRFSLSKYCPWCQLSCSTIGFWCRPQKCAWIFGVSQIVKVLDFWQILEELQKRGLFRRKAFSFKKNSKLFQLCIAAKKVLDFLSCLTFRVDENTTKCLDLTWNYVWNFNGEKLLFEFVWNWNYSILLQQNQKKIGNHFQKKMDPRKFPRAQFVFNLDSSPTIWLFCVQSLRFRKKLSDANKR